MAAITDTITSDWVKNRFTVGIKGVDGDGAAFHSDMLSASIGMAVDLWETKLDLTLRDLTTYTDEQHDLVLEDLYSNHEKQLFHAPIRSITAVKIRHGNQPAIELTPGTEWIRVLNAGQATIAVMPSNQALQAVGSTAWLANMTHEQSGWWLFSYTAGYDGVTYPWPDDILFAIGMQASLLYLDTAGDVLLGAGIASRSISMGGVSQSTNSTASAMYHGLSAKMESYRKTLEMLEEQLVAKYRMPSVGAV